MGDDPGSNVAFDAISDGESRLFIFVVFVGFGCLIIFTALIILVTLFARCALFFQQMVLIVERMRHLAPSSLLLLLFLLFSFSFSLLLIFSLQSVFTEF